MAFKTTFKAAPLAFTLALSTLYAPALAGDAECQTIRASFDAVAAAPAYKQTIDMKAQGMVMEGVVIGDVIYMNPDGSRWVKLPLKKGGRKGMLDQIMSMSAISACAIARTETLSAGDMLVYDYMMAPPKGLPGAGDAPAKHQIWIGTKDGLVHRLVSEGINVTLTYGAIEAPIP